MASQVAEDRPSKVTEDEKLTLIEKITEWSLSWIPDSMVFVLVLTLIIFALAFGLTDRGAIQLVDDYAKGFWVLLTFAMQLSLLMLTGFVVVDSDFVKSRMIKLIDIPKTATSTLILYCVLVGIFSWLHWGVGYMLAMVLGKEIAIRKRGLGIHYPLMVAAGYVCYLVMANGPSQSAPLIAATPGNFVESTIGRLVPISETVLSPFLLVLVMTQFIAVIVLFAMMAPKKDKVIELDEATWKEFSAPTKAVESKAEIRKMRPAERWERSRIFPTIVACIMLFWSCKTIWLQGITKVDINLLNFFFLALALLLQKTPANFVNAVRNGIGTTYGVIIQFPLYAGIFGIISYSGLAHVITDAFVYISTPGTYAWIVMFYTVLMDFFVPSGGSKFAIEAPFIVPAGQQMGVSIAHIINAYSTGSQMANCLQPFWTLAFLATFKIKFQTILPYTFAGFVVIFTIASVAFLVFPT